jgi:hypothetical protein
MLLIKHIKVKRGLKSINKHYYSIKNYFIKYTKDREDLFL